MKKWKRRLSRVLLRGSSTTLHISDGIEGSALNSGRGSYVELGHGDDGGLTLLFAANRGVYRDGLRDEDAVLYKRGSLIFGEDRLSSYYPYAYHPETFAPPPPPAHLHELSQAALTRGNATRHGRLPRPHSTIAVGNSALPALHPPHTAHGLYMNMPVVAAPPTETNGDRVLDDRCPPLPAIVMRTKSRQYESKRERDERKRRVNSWHSSQLLARGLSYLKGVNRRSDDDDFELEPDSTQLKEKMASLGLGESTTTAAGVSNHGKSGGKGEQKGAPEHKHEKGPETATHSDRDEVKRKQLESNAELIQALFGIDVAAAKKEESPRQKSVADEPKREVPVSEAESKPSLKEESAAAAALADAIAATVEPTNATKRRKKKQKSRLDEDMIEGEFDDYDEMMDRYR